VPEGKFAAWAGTTPDWASFLRPILPVAIRLATWIVPAHAVLFLPGIRPVKGRVNMSYIPKQEKRTRERIEAKLDQELIQRLERYCRFLDSDRDYVIAQALEIAFQKDKSFAEWLKSHPGAQAL